jgi:hypothetical protein
MPAGGDGARRALLARLIDHAPLFPPAQLPLAEALEEHRQARESAHGWLVRRFVCPASTLSSLDGEPLELSVVLDAEADLDDPRVASVEVPRNRGVLTAVRVERYVEVATDAMPRYAPLMAADGAKAKIRCGPAPPPIDELAAAIRAFRQHSVPFKATAGLHHAVRQDGAHGFLNLLAAAIFAREEEALAEEDAAAFSLDEDTFSWRRLTASTAEIERGRELFVAFGSCSFSEPVEELQALGFLSA